MNSRGVSGVGSLILVLLATGCGQKEAQVAAPEWTELMFMQIRAGNTAINVFALAVVCVFLALSALYESWALPLAVIWKPEA
jgi:multidrug efflux pump